MRQLVLPFSSGFFARKAIAARVGPRVLNQLLVDLEARVMMVVVCYYRNLRLRRIGYCETKVGKSIYRETMITARCTEPPIFLFAPLSRPRVRCLPEEFLNE